MEKTTRIDKYLWCVRLFKTRSLATEACRTGKILINGLPVKPSKMITAGEIFKMKVNPVLFTFKIIEPINNRISAKLVINYLENQTSETELLKLEFLKANNFYQRDKGTGRPTKKDRREMDRLLDTDDVD
jgi:ribosome-associated heat shock protein Hsp15